MTEHEAGERLKASGVPGHVARAFDGRVVIVEIDGVTFDKLAALSVAFGTTTIDVDCNLGCESDPGHDTSVIVWLDPSKRKERT